MNKRQIRKYATVQKDKECHYKCHNVTFQKSSISEMKKTETVFLTESGGSLYLNEAMCITEKESEREMTAKKIVMIRMQEERVPQHQQAPS